MAGQWEADPMGRAQYRYFDGVNWTHAVATNGVQSTEDSQLPLPASPSQQAALQQAPHVAPTTYQAVQPGYVVRAAGGGKLQAAGIMSIITAAVSFIAGLIVLIGFSAVKSVTDSCGDAIGGDCGSDAVSAVAVISLIVIMAVGAGFLISGIGAVRRVQWGQIAIIVVGGLACLLYLIVLIAAGEPLLLIPILWFGIITGLAIAEDRSVFDRVKAMRQVS